MTATTPPGAGLGSLRLGEGVGYPSPSTGTEMPGAVLPAELVSGGVELAGTDREFGWLVEVISGCGGKE
jgi:hypothetical protein